eukprot:6369721-Prymnesium_polylepis.1
MRRERLTLFEAEFAVLGIDMETATQLDEGHLRKVYRTRSRELHPDLNDAARESEVEPTIYQINEAYTRR